VSVPPPLPPWPSTPPTHRSVVLREVTAADLPMALELTAATAFAWTIPALHRLQLHIEPWNTASIRTAERVGYQREGLLCSHQEIGGRRRDMLLYAAVRPR
jgi:RimJ/RimL family protein N-acetyltransferase